MSLSRILSFPFVGIKFSLWENAVLLLFFSFKSLFSCEVMLALMSREELYTHVSACRELYVQVILCSIIHSMLHTIGRCLAGGKYEEYTETRSEWKVIKVKFWPVMFIHFQGVPPLWARDECWSYRHLNERDADTHGDNTELIDNKPVCLTTVKGRMPPQSFKWNIIYWKVCFGIVTGFHGCVDCSLWNFKLLRMNLQKHEFSYAHICLK